MTPPTPQQLRDIFGENLKKLIGPDTTVSQVCRDIGVNRSQFSRYLSGEAHPRPDVLARICVHFNTDARILIEPIEALRKFSADQPHQDIQFPLLLKRLRSFDHNIMPDGYYRIVRPAFTVPNCASAALITLCTLPDNSTRVASTIDSVHFGDLDQQLAWPQRRTSAMAFQQSIGTAFLFSAQTPRLSQHLSYFTHGHDAAGSLFFGYMTMMRSNEPLHAQVLPAILERYGNRLRDGLRARRRCGVFPYNDLRGTERNYFESWNPFGPFTNRWLSSSYRDGFLAPRR